ncbi:MAG TPA: acetoin utilization protein AcuC [Streptosporangiaceae bacterium]|jgi:acetoin utilization protein AcuC
MTCTLHVAWDDRLTSYDFGPGHPLAPVRVDLTMALARALRVLDGAGVLVAAPSPASQDQLELVHDPQYIDAVRAAAPDPSFGLGTPDNPVFPGMHDASALVAGATLGAAAAVHQGRAEHGVNVAGGLHHAMHRMASGFCVYNDPAIAIRWLLAAGVPRIGYVDIDVHHGDGVEAAFYDDPRVLTISLHEHPMTLFPGTGLPSDTGGPNAGGLAVNVALPAGTGDAGWLRAFDAVVPPLLRQFRPDILVSQHGCDTHRLDPLAHLELSIDGQRVAHQRLHQLAHETAGGRWLLTGGGGYELVQVVPRTWTHLLAEAAGQPIDQATPTPAQWREYTLARTGVAAPERMTEGAAADFTPFEGGYDPADPVDRAIMATRSAVFPSHGLFPGP